MVRIGWTSSVILVALACGGGTLTGPGGASPADSGAAENDASQGGSSPGRAGSSGSASGGSGGTPSGGSGGRAGTLSQGGRSGEGGMGESGSSGSTPSGGSGGRPSSCPSTGCPNAMLPTDVSIFGPLVEGAFYLFREPHLTLDGDRITAATNLANPGTRDLEFPNPPLFLPDGGADGRGAAQFDGIEEFGEATGFSFEQGSTPSILAVLQLDAVSDRISVGVQLNDGTDNPLYFLHAAHIRTMSGDLYRANGHPRGVPHAIDYLTPEASNDTGPHLHETHMYTSGMVAVYDGRVFGGGGDRGSNGTMTTLRVASNALGQPGRGSEHAAMQLSELVIAVGTTPEQAEAYRMERVRTEYPSIDVQ